MKYTEQVLFLFSCGLVFWQAYGNNPDSYTNYKKGLLAVCFVIFIESILKGEIIFFKRYSAFWRACLRLSMLYLCGLVFLAFQNETDARQLLKHVYPELGQPIPTDFHTYDDNCEFYWINIWDNLDHYYAIHLINFFVACLIVRDRWLMHIWHLYDEIIELSFQHILPHFAECWWDHLILDIALSNTPAVEFGLFVIRTTGMKQYDWLGVKGKKSIGEWDIWHNHRRFGGFLQIIAVITVNFLCGFFLINSLWIPPQNSFNIFRLLVWFLSSNMSFRELYTDIDTWGTWERVKHPVSGKARWITLFLCIAEVFVSLKFLKDAGNWNENFVTPVYIWLPWLIFIIASCSFYIYLRFYGEKLNKYPEEYYLARERAKNSTDAKQQLLFGDILRADQLIDEYQQEKLDELKEIYGKNFEKQNKLDKKMN